MGGTRRLGGQWLVTNEDLRPICTKLTDDEEDVGDEAVGGRWRQDALKSCGICQICLINTRLVNPLIVFCELCARALALGLDGRRTVRPSAHRPSVGALALRLGLDGRRTVRPSAHRPSAHRRSGLD